MEIYFNGYLTREQFLSYYKIASRPLKTPGVVIDGWLLLLTMGCALLGIGVWSFFEHSGDGLLWLTLGGCAFIVGFKLRNLPRRLFDENKSFSERRDGTITETEVQIHGELGQSKIPWERLHGYGESAEGAEEEMILLFIDQGVAHIFPKSFFQNDSDWQLFRRLVSGKLEKTHGVSGGQSFKVCVVLSSIFVLLLGLNAIVRYWPGGIF